MGKKKNIEKKVPIKNYIILGIIIFITVLAVLYICSWYKQYNNTKVDEPVITSVLPKVEYNNLDTVVKERDLVIVYMCTTKENICRSFEKKFSSFVKDNNLTDDIIYLNLGYSEDENGMLDKLYNKYKSEDLVKKVYEYPSLVIFSEGKIVDVLSSNNENKVTIPKVEEFLEGYEL